MTPAEYTLALCARIATHTDVPGTITRTFLSPATREVHALLRAEMEALGMTVRIDNAGNLRGLYVGAGGDAPVLLTGSHIDTVPNAGAFDGVLGVALPLALLRSLGGRRFAFAIEVIAFSEEEGVRFRMPFLGSRALVGTLDAETLAREDAGGTSVAQALRDFGLDPDALANARLSANTFAFLEVHVEQGPILESLHLALGAVTGILGQSRLGVSFFGEANHAGTTPMGFRRDALVAGARWIGEVAAYPRVDPDLRATVGSIQALPGASNVIPAEVTVSLDVRHPSDAVRRHAVAALRQLAEECAAATHCTVRFAPRGSQEAVAMNAALVDGIAAATGGDAHRMLSGAGHDAMILAPHVPSAMLFVRTPKGLSHHPDEVVFREDIEAALTACLLFLNTLHP